MALTDLPHLQPPSLRQAAVTLRRLGPADLMAYKSLRDLALQLHPDAFVSDYETEQLRSPESYIGRLGLGEPLGGSFMLGAWADSQLLGCIGCERNTIMKMRHRADVFGLMVHPDATGRGIGRSLVQHAVDEARAASGLRMLLATITIATPDCAERLYLAAGFRRYGVLPQAVRVVNGAGERFYDKAQLVLML